jgi:hypothetical protein
MVGSRGLGDVIVAAKERWQSDTMASYSRGTEKDAVQLSEGQTVMVRIKRRAQDIRPVGLRSY